MTIMIKKALSVFSGIIIFCSVSAQVRTLDFFVQNGLTNSPLLKDYATQAQLQGIDSAILSASTKPQVNGIGMLMVAPTFKGYGYDAAVTNGGNYEAVASVTQPLFVKKIYAPQYEGLRIENQSVVNSGKISAHDLQRDIVDQYLTAWTSMNQLSYNKSILKLLQDEEPVLRSFVTDGIYRQVDFLSFELEKQTQEIQLSQLQLQYRTDLGQLNALCGITDTSYYELANPGIVYTTPTGNISPFIMQFHIDSLRILNAKSMIDMRYRPRLGWFADAGLLTSTPLTAYRNFGFSFGLSFVIPLYDGHQKGFEYRKLAVNESIRSNYETFFTMQQRIRMDQLKQQLAATDKLIAQEKAVLRTSDALVDANKQLLDKGQGAMTDFILAIKSNMDLKNQLNQAEITRLQLMNQLNYWNW